MGEEVVENAQDKADYAYCQEHHPPALDAKRAVPTCTMECLYSHIGCTQVWYMHLLHLQHEVDEFEVAGVLKTGGPVCEKCLSSPLRGAKCSLGTMKC